MLQAAGKASEVNEAIQFYVPVKVATDSNFPFSGGESFVVRVVGDSVVISTPEESREQLELPPIDDDLQHKITQK